MEFRILQYFLAVVREGSISAAAKSLHMTQPTLSTQIKNLEVELGKQLFIRGSKRVTLTEEGKLFQKRAEEIVALVMKTQSEISHDYIGGDLYIGGGESQSMRFVIKCIHEFKQDYPTVQTHLYSGNTFDTLEKLDNGLLDFAVIINAPDMDKYESLKLPVANVMGLLMHKDSSLAQNDAVTPVDLKDIPLMMGRNYATKQTISNWIDYDFEMLNIVARFNLMFNGALMVEEGMGYATSFEGLIPITEDSALCFKPFKPQLLADVYLVWKRHQHFSPAGKKFLDHIVKEVKKQA